VLLQASKVNLLMMMAQPYKFLETMALIESLQVMLKEVFPENLQLL
jgi:hypothetical protein